MLGFYYFSEKRENELQPFFFFFQVRFLFILFFQYLKFRSGLFWRTFTLFWTKHKLFLHNNITNSMTFEFYSNNNLYIFHLRIYQRFNIQKFLVCMRMLTFPKTCRIPNFYLHLCYWQRAGDLVMVEGRPMTDSIPLLVISWLRFVIHNVLLILVFYSEWWVIVVLPQVNNCSDISWKKQVTFRWVDNDVHFVLDQYA